jgi:beta-glucosidase-like glycosyl hydrolase
VPPRLLDGNMMSCRHTGADHSDSFRDAATVLLRERFGLDGIVCTDSDLINDAEYLAQPMPACAWGSRGPDTTRTGGKVLQAGCDQFGGDACEELVVELARRSGWGDGGPDRSVGAATAVREAPPRVCSTVGSTGSAEETSSAPTQPYL